MWSIHAPQQPQVGVAYTVILTSAAAASEQPEETMVAPAVSASATNLIQYLIHPPWASAMPGTQPFVGVPEQTPGSLRSRVNSFYPVRTHRAVRLAPAATECDGSHCGRPRLRAQRRFDEVREQRNELRGSVRDRHAVELQPP